MNKPHKHAEVIKAWADGAIIQWKHGPKDKWHTASGPFVKLEWFIESEYRVNPELKDPGVVCRDAFYKAINPKCIPNSRESKEWTAAAMAVIEAYKAEELKVD